LRVLLIHDQMLTKGGSERVFTYLTDIFPEAEIFTSTYNPNTSIRFNRSKDLKVSNFFNAIIRNSTTFKFFFPILTYYFQFKNFKGYDLIISSSATCAKYVRNFNGKHICYCYVPTRAIWEIDNYFPRESLVKSFFKILLPYFKKRDLETSKYIDLYIGDSRESSRRIKKTYNSRTTYAYSPIEFSNYSSFFSSTKKDYYLLVSRLDYWKRVDVAVDAFNKNGRKLIIVGSGEAHKELSLKAKENIEFLNNVSDQELGKLYSSAKGVIFTCDLEHGLIPIEANACGTAVLCYGFGGVKDTMVNFNGKNSDKATAVFFYEQNFNSLNNALAIFEKIHFNSYNIRDNARKFSRNIFKDNIKSIVSSFLKNDEKVLNEN